MVFQHILFVMHLKTYLSLLDGVLNANGSENVERRSAGEPGEPGPDRLFLSVSISNRIVYANLMQIELADTEILGDCVDVYWKLNGRKEMQ